MPVRPKSVLEAGARVKRATSGIEFMPMLGLRSFSIRCQDGSVFASVCSPNQVDAINAEFTRKETTE